MRQFEQYYYSRGKNEFRNGSLGHSFLRVENQFGLLPLDVYKGHKDGTQYHDHRDLLKKLKSLAEMAVDDKELHLYRTKAEALLDEHLGEVSETFLF